MRAIQVAATGGPERLRLAETDAPEPAAGEALVRVAYAGVNFIDVYHRTGLYPKDLPFTPGMEGSGRVEAVGEGVDHLAPGDPVAWAMHPGSYRELATVPAWRLVRVPDSVGLDAAAAVMLQGMTAHYLCRSTYPVGAEDVVLIHAAAGGVGLLLTQLVHAAGATVFGTCSTEEKAERVRAAGADQVIRYTERDFREEVDRLTAGGGCSVVYDSVGRDTFHDSLRCLRPRGYLVLFGQSSGPVEPFDPALLARGGSLFLTRPSLAQYAADREEVEWRAGELLDAVAAGTLDVRIHDTLPLADAAAAHAMLESRETSGKVLLEVE